MNIENQAIINSLYATIGSLRSRNVHLNALNANLTAENTKFKKNRDKNLDLTTKVMCFEQKGSLYQLLDLK